jgi:uncharacterized protein YjbI with pentapeptide repeats
MSSEDGDLVAWCRRQHHEALSQIELFGAGGVKAVLQMPDGTTQDITSSVLAHQTENAAVFERLASALEAVPPFERRNLAGTLFKDCSLAGATFDDIDLSGALFSNVNLRQARLTNVNMTGVAIDDANIEGLTIYGIDIHALVQAELTRLKPR